jgi:hypothetical protein
MYYLKQNGRDLQNTLNYSFQLQEKSSKIELGEMIDNGGDTSGTIFC